MKIDTLYLIGCGGTGSHLAEPLARLLAYHRNGTNRVILIDGDTYEQKNMDRQLFDRNFLNRSKADAMAERLSFCDALSIQSYVNQDRFSKILGQFNPNPEDTILVVTAVDNHQTRHHILKALQDRPNVVVLIPGNQETKGHVILYLKENGVEKTVHPFARYPNIEKPKDRIPEVGGCHMEQASTPQLIIANAFAAVLTLNFVQNLLDENPMFDELYFDSIKMKTAQGCPL